MRSRLLKAGMISFFMLTALLPSNAATRIFRPGPEDGKDVSLYKRTDVPLSSGPSLYVINTGPPGPGLDNFASLVAFDLDELSATASVVETAKLWLYENNVATFSFQHVSAEFPNRVEVQPAATSWFEDTVFYSTLHDPVSRYSATQTVDAAAAWFSWEVTDAVKDWLSGALPNNGFLITSKFEVRSGSIVVGSSFDSSEQNNPPYLEIELMNINAGDYNLNGLIDAADYVVWRNQFNTLVPETTGADGNGDGIVNADDYAVWRGNFGMVSGSALHNTIAVPEPPSVVLVALVSCMVVGQMRVVRCRTRISRVLLAFFTLLTTAAPTSAAVIPFTEDFSTGAANWKDIANADVTYVPSGGVGDGYISVQRTFTANPTTAQTIFRGHDQFNSSNDAFVGDWLMAGIRHFSFWVRHNAASDLTFGTRFATSAIRPGRTASAFLPSRPTFGQWSRSRYHRPMFFLKERQRCSTLSSERLEICRSPRDRAVIWEFPLGLTLTMYRSFPSQQCLVRCASWLV